MLRFQSTPIRIVACALTTLSLWVGSSLTLTAFAQFVEPSNPGLPARTEGGGTRGDCLNSELPLTALVPRSGYGETIAEHPTFLWYVPDVAAEAAEFILRKQDGTEVYRATFQITGGAGLISLSLPKDANLMPLEIDQNYEWVFSLICDSQDRSGDVYTNGWVRRVEKADLESQLASADTDDRPNLYAQAGLWYDALDALAALYRAQPDDSLLASRWIELLGDDAVELGHLADIPFISAQDMANFSDSVTVVP